MILLNIQCLTPLNYFCNKMGLFDFFQNKLAKGPAIIGTANTLAKHFLAIKKELPDLSNKEIYQIIIEQRYSLIPIPEPKRAVLEKYIIEKELSFKQFVLYVLSSETELSETGPDFIFRVMNTIEDELKKYNSLPK